METKLCATRNKNLKTNDQTKAVWHSFDVCLTYPIDESSRVFELAAISTDRQRVLKVSLRQSLQDIFVSSIKHWNENVSEKRFKKKVERFYLMTTLANSSPAGEQNHNKFNSIADITSCTTKIHFESFSYFYCQFCKLITVIESTRTTFNWI